MAANIAQTEKKIGYSRPMADSLPHLDAQGAAHMVDVSEKPKTARTAHAEAFVRLNAETLQLIQKAELKKGDALAVARLAGIQAAKATPQWILLAHPLALTKVSVELSVAAEGVQIDTMVKTTGPTGVEMEALTAASAAALNLYDMIKAHQKDAVIEKVQLVSKTGGQRGDYKRDSSK